MHNKTEIGLNSLLDLKVFIHVVNMESFTKVADHLHLSRSAVGKSIRRLESALNSRLLHRTTRTVQMSQEGKIFYDYAQRILSEAEEIENLLSHRSQIPKGLLAMTVPVVFGRKHIMPLLLEFLQSYPEVDVKVNFSDDYLDLIAEGYDIAIRIGDLPDSSLVQKPLTHHQLITCASPKYLAKHSTPRSIDALQHHECLRYIHRGQTVPWRFFSELNNVEITPRGRIALQDTEALKEAALMDFGIVQLSTFLLSEEINTGLLIPVLQDIQPLREQTYAVYPSKKHLSPKVRKFIDYIANHLP